MTHNNGSWAEFADVEGIWQLILGFLNATQISFGGNRTTCQFAMEAVADSTVFATQVATEKWPNYWNVLKAIDSYLVVPYSLHSLVYGCYWGVLEMADLLFDYIVFHKDPLILAFNFAYNLGFLATAIRNIWMWNVAKEYTRVRDAFTMGIEIGQLFWLIFYPAQQYLDQQLALEDKTWKWGQDYTWDAILRRRDLAPGEERLEPVWEAPDPSKTAATEWEFPNFGEFLARHLPGLKARAVVEPQPPDHGALRAKVGELRSKSGGGSQRPWHLVFLSGLATRFFE